MANISHRLGRTLPAPEVRDRIQGNRALRAAFERFQAHMEANGIDAGQLTVSPMLTMDPARERYTGELSERANRLVTREYRKPYVVPERV